MSSGLPATVRSCAVLAVRKPRHVSPLPAEATPAMMELRCFAPGRRSGSSGDPGSARAVRSSWEQFFVQAFKSVMRESMASVDAFPSNTLSALGLH